MKKGSGSFREHIDLPFGGSLDVVFVDTGSLQKVDSACLCEHFFIFHCFFLTDQSFHHLTAIQASDDEWSIEWLDDQSIERTCKDSKSSRWRLVSLLLSL